jgi:hypothetical protein
MEPIKQTLLFLLLALTIGCNKDTRDSVQGSIDAEFDIPNGLNTIETHVFVIEDVTSFFEQTLLQNGRSINDIDEVLSAKGDLVFPFISGSINFLDKVSIRIYNRFDPNNYKEMYYLDAIPLNANNPLKLFSTISNLQPILENENFDMEVRLKFRAFTPPNLRVRLDFGYTIYFQD